MMNFETRRIDAPDRVAIPPQRRTNMAMRKIVESAIRLAKYDRDQALDIMTSHLVPIHVAVRIMAGKQRCDMGWSKS